MLPSENSTVVLLKYESGGGARATERSGGGKRATKAAQGRELPSKRRRASEGGRGEAAP